MSCGFYSYLFCFVCDVIAGSLFACCFAVCFRFLWVFVILCGCDVIIICIVKVFCVLLLSVRFVGFNAYCCW